MYLGCPPDVGLSGISAVDFIRQLERQGNVAALTDIADDAEGPSSEPGKRHRFNILEKKQAGAALARLVAKQRTAATPPARPVVRMPAPVVAPAGSPPPPAPPLALPTMTAVAPVEHGPAILIAAPRPPAPTADDRALTVRPAVPVTPLARRVRTLPAAPAAAPVGAPAPSNVTVTVQGPGAPAPAAAPAAITDFLARYKWPLLGAAAAGVALLVWRGR